MLDLIGDILLQTYKESGQLVDESVLTNPFKIEAGSLYNIEMAFEPDQSSVPNPMVNLKLTN